MRLMRRSLGPGLAAAIVAAAVTGCGNDDLMPPPPADPTDAFWALTLDHRAVTLSLADGYDTLTLAATPRNFRGEALADLPPPTYESRNPELVVVSETGQLFALGATTQPVWVVATLTADNLNHRDSALVYVVDVASPPRLAELSATPVPPDSAKFGEDLRVLRLASRRLPLRMIDSSGHPITGVVAYFGSSDTTTALIDSSGRISGKRPGPVTFYASATVFGIAMADTVPFRIGLPAGRLIGVTQQPTESGDSVWVPEYDEFKLGVGGLVVWNVFSADSVQIRFEPADLPRVVAPSTWAAAPLFDLVPVDFATFCQAVAGETCGTGGDVTFVSVAMRVFDAPGVYEYHSPTHGFRGRIIVNAEE